ncbi:hypothetical protein PPERSA_11597 [Pseudocohnilembus persalinus]|uniref:Uncharacterized protein n=1 Tax=Pseudocohnilembus persalinus TaxID=266149 RepID=A0A0V0QAA7_PSEPJ|nr:hypothetical protein PPERSA_11597 [Pseudocohnilembus persalinus]|eukprot:KRW98996.1 hypothetical protein PPERSA_11597 [Pseudocohnilembus persalinus]
MSHLKIAKTLQKQRKILNIILILCMIFLNNQAIAQDSEDNSDDNSSERSSRIGGTGIGGGVLIILIAGAISIVICFLSPGTAKPEFVAVGGLILPIFFIILFALMPKDADKEDDEDTVEEDSQGVVKYIVQALLIVGGLISLLWLLVEEVFQERYTRLPENWIRKQDQDKKKQEQKTNLLKQNQQNQQEDPNSQLNRNKDDIRDWTKGEKQNINSDVMGNFDASRTHNKDFLQSRLNQNI